jgi:hypothetical protein
MILHEDHIWELADEIGATVRWTRDRRFARRSDGSHHGSATGALNEITLGWQASGEDAYWVALHELGHIALGHVGLPDTPEGTCGEADAWLWALEHARVAPTPSVARRMDESIQTYVDKRGWHPMVAVARAAFRMASKGYQHTTEGWLTPAV